VTVGKLDIKLSERSGKIINQEGNSQGSNITENWQLRVSHLAKFREVCQQGIKLGMDSHLCAFLRPRIICLNRLWQRLLRKVSFHRSTLSKTKIQGAKPLHKIVALEIARWAPDGLSKGAQVTCRFWQLVNSKIWRFALC
jgi:hypothetical protein